MDVVYPCRSGNSNEELRYSLRAIRANLYYRNIYLIGAPPAWTQNVHKMYHEQGVNPRINTTTSMIRACNHPEISDPFIWMNDDYFIMKPLFDIPALNRGPIDSVINNMPNNKHDYTLGMVYTKRLLIEGGFVEGNVLSYELHMPLIVHKNAMLYALKVYNESKLPNLHKRTLYGNIFDYGGETVPDCKIVTREAEINPESLFLSTSDQSFEKYPVGQFIKGKFPDASPYEYLTE